MENTNEMELIFDSSPVNEGLARVTVAAFWRSAKRSMCRKHIP